MKYVIIAIFFLGGLSCNHYAQNTKLKKDESVVINESHYSVAVFAQGCFWCLEEIFQAVVGVEEVISGYSGGDKENPSYKEVGSGKTNHAEAVKVIYDTNLISYQDLLKVYFNSGDITQVNGQGNDRGTQYRSIVFYSNTKEHELIMDYIEDLPEKNKSLAVQVLPFNFFFKAEEYHQDFVSQHPNHGYVKAVSIPRFNKAIKNFPELLK